MLLEFRTKNYRSFKDTTTFSMQPAPKQTGLDYSVQTEQIVQKEGKLKEMKGTLFCCYIRSQCSGENKPDWGNGYDESNCLTREYSKCE